MNLNDRRHQYSHRVLWSGDRITIHLTLRAEMAKAASSIASFALLGPPLDVEKTGVIGRICCGAAY